VAEIFGSIADLMRTRLQNGWEECRYAKICPSSLEHYENPICFSNSTTLLELMRSVLLCLPIVFITSCATVTRGSHDKLTVLSEPAGANVILSSGEKGVTPTKFVKSRRDNFTVTVSKAGYVPQTVNVESKLSATGGTAMAGNVIVAGPVGAAVDSISGAYNSLYPNPVSVRLVPLRKSVATAAIERRRGPSRATKSSSTAPRVKPSSLPSPRTSSSTEPTFPTAKAVPGKPGYVISPFDTKGRYIDVSGYPSGSKAKDPWTDKIFIVP
jgi:PEGA domain